MPVKLIAEEADVVRLAWEGPLSLNYSQRALQTLPELVGPHIFSRQVLLNLERSEFIDSSGIGWLVNNHLQFTKNGGRLILHSVPPLIIQVLQFCRMDSVFHIAAGEAAARALALEKPR